MKSFLALILIVCGCGKTRTCKQGTILVDVTLHGAAAGADTFDLTVTIGSDTRHASRAHTTGAEGTLELDFPSGQAYPAGQTLTLTLTAESGGQPVGQGSVGPVALPPGCAFLSLTVEANGDLAIGGSDLASEMSPPDLTVVPDPAHSTLTADRTTGIIADGVDAVSLTITLLDGTGAPVAGQAVSLIVNPSPMASVAPIPPTDAQGVTHTQLTSTLAGAKSIYASIHPPDDLVPQPPLALQFVAGPSAGLAFTQQPSNVTIQFPFAPVVEVAEVDGFGNVVATATDSITVQLGTNPSGAALIGPSTLTAVAGRARFAPLGLDKIGSGYTLVASSPAFPSSSPVSQSFNVLAPAWVPVSSGLEGGFVTACGGDPAWTSLYASTYSSFFKSTDGGNNWTPSGLGLSSGAYSIAVDPSHTSTVYVATYGGTTFKSLDGGASFFALATSVGPLAVDADGAVYGFTKTDFVRSLDGGATFVPTAVSPTQSTLPTFAVVPSPSPALYVIAGGTVQVSHDHGISFSAITAGLGTAPPATLAASAAGAWLIDQNHVVYREVAGPQWSAVTPPGGSPTSIFSDAGGGNVVVVNVLNTAVRSLNSGGSWSSFSNQPSFGKGAPGTILVDPSGNAFSCAGSFATTYKGTNNGMSFAANNSTQWVPMNQGLYGANIYQLAASSTQVLYASTDQGLFKTINGGSTWTSLGQPTFLSGLDPLGGRGWLNLDANSNIVYLHTHVSDSWSSDGGTTWNVGASAGTAGAALVSPAPIASPSPSPTLWALLDGNPASITISQNGAASWSAPQMLGSANAGSTASSTSLASNLDLTNFVAYAGTAAGLFRSDASGSVWTSLSAGTILDGKAIELVGFNPTSKLLSVFSNDTLAAFVSTDQGASWMQEPLPITHPSGLMYTSVFAYQYVDAEWVTVTGADQMILYRASGASDWQRADRGLSGIFPLTLGGHPFIGSSGLFLGTFGAGVWKSTTLGL